MGTRVLALELPEEVVALLGSQEAATARVRETLVLDLLREGRLSQGMAAQLLELTRGQLLDLMSQRQIPSAPESVEDVRRELDDLRRLSGESADHGGRQRQ